VYLRAISITVPQGREYTMPVTMEYGSSMPLRDPNLLRPSEVLNIQAPHLAISGQFT